MKYAIISDIHGNLPALEMVLEDAKRNNVDSYIFVGDYCLSNPFPNECIDKIRSMKNKYVISGNEESYFEYLADMDQNTWLDGQMQVSYYCYRAVSEENRNYILSLPKRIELSIYGVKIFIAHSSTEFIEDCEHKEWSADKTATKYKEKKITEESLQKDIRRYFDEDEKSCSVINSLESGIYIFGHSHIRWNWQSKDGKVTLINAGSCGLPLDGIKNSIPYTILDVSEQGQVTIEEKGLPFPMEEYIKTLINSSQYKDAKIWTNVIVKELRFGLEHVQFFLRYAEEYACKIGDMRRPFAVDTWEKAYELWEKEYNFKNE